MLFCANVAAESCSICDNVSEAVWAVVRANACDSPEPTHVPRAKVPLHSHQNQNHI